MALNTLTGKDLLGIAVATGMGALAGAGVSALGDKQHMARDAFVGGAILGGSMLCFALTFFSDIQLSASPSQPPPPQNVYPQVGA